MDNPKCSCDICSGRITRREQEKSEQEYLKSPGWYAHLIGDDNDSPTGFNYHTHGFDITADHLDIQIVLPLPPDVCQLFSTSFYHRIKREEKFEPGEVCSDILESNKGKPLDVMFIEVTECDRPVLRVIFPDREGHLLAKDVTEEYTDFALQWS